jgi:hypothetical protein
MITPMRVQQILREYGYALTPMTEAPRDGRPIVAFSKWEGAKIYCWQTSPRFAGPAWFEHPKDGKAYVDRYFQGWIDLSTLRPIDEIGLRRLLIAHIDEGRAKGDPMSILEDVPDRRSANDR